MDRISIKEIYNQRETHPTPDTTVFITMLWDSLAALRYPFLQFYRDNSPAIDKYFTRKYASFEYDPIFESDKKEIHRFKEDVSAITEINANKFAELFRLENLDDEKYSLYNNYDMTETAHTSATADLGSRTDISSVSPYDTDTFSGNGKNELGAQLNTNVGDSTLTRVGNIGVMTVSDMIAKHEELFSKYISFYDRIFEIIARELLYVGEVD